MLRLNALMSEVAEKCLETSLENPDCTWSLSSSWGSSWLSSSSAPSQGSDTVRLLRSWPKPPPCLKFVKNQWPMKIWNINENSQCAPNNVIKKFCQSNVRMSIPRKTSWVFFQKKRPKLRSSYHRGSQFWSYPRGWSPGPARSCTRWRWRWRWCRWRRPRQCHSSAGNFVVTANFGWKDVLNKNA